MYLRILYLLAARLTYLPTGISQDISKDSQRTPEVVLAIQGTPWLHCHHS